MTIEAITDLRAFVAADHEPESPSAQIAERFRAYLDGAPNGLTLEEAFSLKPSRGGDPWWVLEARSKRDAAIRLLARPFVIQPIAEQAKQVIKLSEQYRRGRWRFDQYKSGVEYNDPKNRALHEILSGTSGSVPSESTVRRILVGHEIPDLVNKSQCSNS